MAKNFVGLYPDLVDPSDLVGQQLVAELHTFFNHTVPSSLRAAAVPQRTPRRTFSFSLPRWPRVALVSLLSIFALVGATYVALPLLQQLWASDRGLVHVANAGLVRDLDLAQTNGSVTVRLQRAYMDANRVVVGYTVEFPPSVRVFTDPSFAEATLTDDAGTQYRGLASTYAGASPLGAHVLNFETPVAQSAGRDITFTLTVPRAWVFTFVLASAPSRVIEPALAVTAGDLRLTFTRVVVAPSATRFDYRITQTGTVEGITGSMGLIVGGRNLDGAGHCERNGQCFFMTTEPLFDLQTLTIDEVIFFPDLPANTGASARNTQAHVKGPFVLVLRP